MVKGLINLQIIFTMTTREFAAKLLTEHFVDKSIDHLHSAWGHNFNSEFKDRKDSTYTAISLILRYWHLSKENTSINLLIAWLQEPVLCKPFNSCSYLAWNLYYSLCPEPTEIELRKRDQLSSMYSLLRHIELNKAFDCLDDGEKQRLTEITKYIIG